MELLVIARFFVKRGNEAAVRRLLPELVQASRAETGNLAYGAYQSLEDEREILIVERYTSRDAFAVHRTSEHFEDLALGKIFPLLDSRAFDAYDVPAGEQ
jgi:quinol monooxygenase YgiN